MKFFDHQPWIWPWESDYIRVLEMDVTYLRYFLGPVQDPNLFAHLLDVSAKM